MITMDHGVTFSVIIQLQKRHATFHHVQMISALLVESFGFYNFLNPSRFCKFYWCLQKIMQSLQIFAQSCRTLYWKLRDLADFYRAHKYYENIIETSNKKPFVPPEFKKAKKPTIISTPARTRNGRSAKFDDLPFFEFDYDYEDNLAADLTPGARKQFIKGWVNFV